MPRLLKVSEVATICQVHPKTVRRAIGRGELRAARLGAAGALRIREEDVDAWVTARLTGEAAPGPAPRGWLTA
jgi:excisionase family DNA binding protein